MALLGSSVYDVNILLGSKRNPDIWICYEWKMVQGLLRMTPTDLETGFILLGPKL